MALEVYHTVPAQTGTVTVVWPGAGRGVPAHATHWSNVLLRDYGHGWPAPFYVADDNASLEKLFEFTPYRVRVVTDNQTVVAQVKEILNRRPEFASRVEILVLPPMPKAWP